MLVKCWLSAGKMLVLNTSVTIFGNKICSSRNFFVPLHRKLKIIGHEAHLISNMRTRMHVRTRENKIRRRRYLHVAKI